ncbi:DUF1062 domain-containing protein [Actinomadura barringtoniae]|uniref:DUF1062 domain-containing protein n=1 Tax=Actinomadura barringtoniae TaxID=1427535 RepID=A0A939T3J9_9ACTN|nr:DUF1062 domain-containing protein [Actinomadura barringtoniae]MBO2451281.1 DUF1062 domain-containing protein [Actinomadura barringtoniae]
MSQTPTWVVRRTRLPLLSLRCPDCESESATASDARFRVGANPKWLAVWLIVHCVSCDRPTKLTVHERTPVRSVARPAFDGYHANDPGLIASTLIDPQLARRNRFTLDWTGAWQLDSPPPDEAVPVQVLFKDPVPLRPDWLIAQGLGLSRNEALRHITCDIPLRRPTTTPFTFTLTPEDDQEF